MRRTEALARLADLVLRLDRPHPVRVAIDGVDGAGKTILGNELATVLAARGRPCIRATIDGFHRPTKERYQRGRNSPEGYYVDSFDLSALRRELLNPLGPGGSRRYRPRVFDHGSDRPVTAPQRTARENSILLFDGIFLLRPELIDSWDLSIFVEVSAETGARRALERDSVGDSLDASRMLRYRDRYMPAQRRYVETGSTS